jgi:hypothetical protein
MFNKARENKIRVLSSQILTSILDENTKYDSFGIIDGMDIINNYLDNNEVGLALNHLEYIISETDFELSANQVENLMKLKNRK